ncbi:MAG TPA: AAA family ATPase [Pilimelia sp.]|nr:AAA family ATPase [Pilimelia sp.]
MTAVPAAARPAKQATLLERDRELDAIDRALAEAIDGRGAVVVVEGPAGIGKTALLRAAAAAASGKGLCVLTARGAAL